MNRNDFLNMISDPGPVNRQMMGEVYELIDIFPYFQSAHLLLLKSLYSSSDVKFENQLKNSAIHIGDREVLYWLLNKKAETYTQNALAVENPEVIKEEVTTENEYDHQQTVIESAKNSDLMISNIENDSVGTGMDQKHDEGEHHTGHSILLAVEPEITEPAGVLIIPEEDNTSDKVFFMDPGFSVDEDSDLLELDLEADDSPFGTDREPEPLPVEKKITKQLQSELIDKFIITNPRIEPHKDKAFMSNVDISKPFTEDGEGLVTETLAKIYIGQGYYSKAIDIFGKLSLKFPEKSSYFASQIEKVKEYIKK